MTMSRRYRAAASPCVAALALIVAAPAAAQPAPPPGCTGPASDTWINVVVEGVKDDQGLVAITLYADDSSKFLAHHGSLYVGRVPAQQGTTRGCIFVPRPGIYALAIYHDSNANRKFDRTGLGLPAEAYGFSNNPTTLAGLPAFRSVRIAIPKTNLVTRVRLTYP